MLACLWILYIYIYIYTCTSQHNTANWQGYSTLEVQWQRWESRTDNVHCLRGTSGQSTLDWTESVAHAGAALTRLLRHYSATLSDSNCVDVLCIRDNKHVKVLSHIACEYNTMNTALSQDADGCQVWHLHHFTLKTLSTSKPWLSIFRSQTSKIIITSCAGGYHNMPPPHVSRP